jgi:leader peptidase (prepilin peptidase) / N-methyltransferase
LSAAAAWARTRPLGAVCAVALALAVLARYGPGSAGVIAAFACAVLVVLAFIDLEAGRLPNRIVLPAAALVLVARLVTEPEHWAIWLAATFGAAAGFLVLYLVYPAGIGPGDVKLALLLGAALGGAILPALLIGTLAGVVPAIARIARHGAAAARKQAFSYGPYLVFGAIATLLLAAPR